MQEFELVVTYRFEAASLQAARDVAQLFSSSPSLGKDDMMSAELFELREDKKPRRMAF